MAASTEMKARNEHYYVIKEIVMDGVRSGWSMEVESVGRYIYKPLANSQKLHDKVLSPMFTLASAHHYK
jgi:hypothetical protein